MIKKIDCCKIWPLTFYCFVSDDNTSSIIIASNYEVTKAIQNSIYPSATRPVMMSKDQYSASDFSKIEHPNQLHLTYENLTNHPCDGFAVPPTLFDKKRTGPRRKLRSLQFF
jgi:hypothetical protein